MKTVFLAFICVFSLQTTAHAQAFMTEEGTAEFTSKVPLHTFTGSSENLVGQVDLTNKTIDFYIDLSTLKTGNKKRDKDMYITLETKDYPFAEFFGKLVSDFDPTISDPQAVRVAGEFKIHGVTRKIEVDGSLQKTPAGLVVVANWQINIKDYNIVPPSLLIMKVDEVQDIRIEATLAPTNS